MGRTTDTWIAESVEERRAIVDGELPVVGTQSSTEIGSDAVLGGRVRAAAAP